MIQKDFTNSPDPRHRRDGSLCHYHSLAVALLVSKMCSHRENVVLRPAKETQMNAAKLLYGFILLVGFSSTEPPGGQAGKELLMQGDQLADQAKYTEALLKYKLGYEKILPDLRGLNFKEPVAPQFMERTDLQQHMKKLLKEDMTEHEIELSDASLKVFGFVQPDFKTEDTLLQLYSEEVAGFYDPKRKQMVLIKETEAPKPQKPGLLARLLGAKTGFDKDEQKSTLSHEMAHALADQHFDLLKLQEAAEKDDDRALALQALVEGEAMLVMMADMERAGGGTGAGILRASPAAMDFSFRLMQGILPFASGKAFRSAPPIFRETMMFGYLKGMVFLLHLTNESEWKRVNQAFREPPLSTEQILHPEKFLKELDEPTEIELPPLGDVLGADWKEVGQNVLGELQISVMLRKQWGARAAAGWDGDRFAVFSGPNDKLALVWYTTWDSEADAKEFAGAYSRYAATRIGLADASAGSAGQPEPPTIADRLMIEKGGRGYLIHRQGSDVVIIEGLSEKAIDAVSAVAFKAEKKVKK